jgi:predicted RNase H-like nuclease (RuvC/YqgF family)
MDTYASIVIPIVVAFIAAIFSSGIWALIAQRKKTKAEADNQTALAADTIQRAASGLVMTYQKRIAELEIEIKELTERIDNLEKKLDDRDIEIKRLIGENRELNRRIARME